MEKARSRFILWLASAFLAHRFTSEFDAVRVVNQAIENAVGHGWVADLFVPVGER
jgi:hypothetical protein